MRCSDKCKLDGTSNQTVSIVGKTQKNQELLAKADLGPMLCMVLCSRISMC